MTDDIRRRLLQETEQSLRQYEGGSISLHEFARRMEQPIHDAKARGEEHEMLLSAWTEIEIINSISLDEDRVADEEERAAALEAGRRIVAMTRERCGDP